MSVYVFFLALILHPTFQAHNVFLHAINIPFHYDLSKPDKIIGKGRARNFHIRTSDDVRIAGWHVLPNGFVGGDRGDGDEAESKFDEALCDAPVVLYFHGNAMNRAAPVRVRAYNAFTALGVNVVAIDYRGFGDSHGTPTEEGLLRDARAAYKWVVDRQRRQERRTTPPPGGDGRPRRQRRSAAAGEILLSGQSLGTGVTARLTLDLVEAGRAPLASLLLAPYVSIRQLLTSYRIGGVLPLFWPLGLSKALSGVADRYLYTRFESDKALYMAARGGIAKLSEEERTEIGPLDFQLPADELRQQLGLSNDDDDDDEDRQGEQRKRRVHIVIAHADDDLIIPNTHGRTLFNRVHDALSAEALIGRVAESESEDAQRLYVEDRPWGTLLTVSPRPGQASSDLSLIKSTKGGHNGVPEHALEYFVNVATGALPAQHADTAEAERGR